MSKQQRPPPKAGAVSAVPTGYQPNLANRLTDWAYVEPGTTLNSSTQSRGTTSVQFHN